MAPPRLAGVPYWILPLLAGSAWLITLLSILIAWIVKGSPHYPEMWPKQHLAYISNAGASDWGYPLFVTGSTITALLFAITFVSERWLRHKSRLLHSSQRWTAVCWIIAAVLTCIATLAQVLYTVFCVRYHAVTHYSLVAIFALGNIFAASFICVEKNHISNCYPSNTTVRHSLYIKLFFIAVEIFLVILGSVTMYRQMYRTSVVIEWTAAFLFSFYMASFAVDFTAVPAAGEEKADAVYFMSRVWDEEGRVQAPRRTYRLTPRQYIPLP